MVTLGVILQSGTTDFNNMKVTFLQDSFLKHRPVPPDQLGDYEKEPVRAGEWINIIAARPELERDNLYITLSQDPGEKFKTVDGRNSVYLVPSHTDYEVADTTDPNVRAAAATYNRISDQGLELLKAFEGCKLTAYYCAANVLTIGYGSTGKHIQEGMTITQDEADDLLHKDLKRFMHGVQELVTVPLTHDQFSALVSFAFNCGLGALEDSTLLKRVNNEEFEGVADAFNMWVKGGNKVLQGLVRRRKSEAHLFNEGVYKSFE